MKVLVAGAAGALGPPVVRQLLRNGHQVTGTTRSIDRKAFLQHLGAGALIVDVFDAPALERAVAEASPEVIVDLLTALPKPGPIRARELEATNRVRTEGSGNLLAAALGHGVRRYVAESFLLIYGTGRLGSEPLTEDLEVPVGQPAVATLPAIEAIATKEKAVLAAARAGRLEGIVLRFAGFYGPGAGTEELIEQLRKRRVPVAAGATGVTPWVHIEDAAAAVVAAVERGRSGSIYNVAEDESLALGDFLRCLAKAARAPAPLTVPPFVIGLVAPYLKTIMLDSQIRLSNARAKSELGWTPRFRSPLEGLPPTVAELEHQAL